MDHRGASAIDRVKYLFPCGGSPTGRLAALAVFPVVIVGGSRTRVSIGGSESGLRSPGTGGGSTTGGLAALEGSPVVSSRTRVSIGGSEGGLRSPGTGGDNTTGGLAGQHMTPLSC